MYGPPESAYDYFEDEGLPLPGPLPPEGGFVRPPGPSPAPGLGGGFADVLTRFRERLAAASNGNQVMAQPGRDQIMMEPGGVPTYYPAPVELPTPDVVRPPVAIVEPPPVPYPSPVALPPEPVPLPIEPGGLPGPIVGPNGPNGPAVTLAGIDPTLALILGLGVLSALLFSK